MTWTQPNARTILAAAIAVYAGLELYLTRGTTLFIDEVTMFTQANGIHPSSLLAPFNEHLELARRLVYGVGLPLFSAGTTFELAKVVQILAVAALAVAVFSFVARRLGEAAALVPTVLLLFFGSVWELNFAISGIGNVLALAGGTWALLVLERRRDLAGCAIACGLLVVAVVSFTTGIAFAVGALCMLLIRRETRSRAWVALVPLAVYGAWLLWVRLSYAPTHSGAQHVSPTNLLLLPNEMAQQGGATIGALLGINYDFQSTSVFSVFSTTTDPGIPLAILAGAALAWRMRRGASPLLWGLVATLIVYWVELALATGAGRNPTTVRYAYASGTIVLLIAATAVAVRVRSRGVLVALGVLLAFSLAGNLYRLRDGMRFYRTFGTTARAQLAALEISGRTVSPGYTVSLGEFAPVSAGDYLAAVRRYGSPGFSQSELLAQPEAQRESADQVLVGAERIAAQPAPAGAAASQCLHRQSTPGAALSFAVRAPGLALRASAPAHVLLGRFGSAATVAVGMLSPGRLSELRIPADNSSQPWRLAVAPGSGSVDFCTLPATP